MGIFSNIYHWMFGHRDDGASRHGLEGRELPPELSRINPADEYALDRVRNREAYHDTEDDDEDDERDIWEEAMDEYNPATGLPTLDGMVDVMGDPLGYKGDSFDDD